MKLIAQLTMPNVGSWNGRWSGEKEKFTIRINVKPKMVDNIIGNYYYRWNDGWGANVEIRRPALREKVTNKFCGYEWMVKSILQYGEIKLPNERDKQ
jgi:hypothetical protein